jgi:ribosomal protein S18 acetylase RimI-like enzyme
METGAMQASLDFALPEISLRPAVPTDVPAITRCVLEAYSPWVPIIGRRPLPMRQDYASVVSEAWVTVAEQTGQLVGVLVLHDTPDGLLIDNVAVLPSHRGLGIGKALLLHAERVGRSLNQPQTYLYTNEKMVANISLYSKLGYREYERRQEEDFRLVFMRKVLGAPV